MVRDAPRSGTRIGLVSYESHEGIALNTLQRRERRNALNGALAANAPLKPSTLKRRALATMPGSSVENYYRLKGALDRIVASDDFAEGGGAFKAKRKPRLEGK